LLTRLFRPTLLAGLLLSLVCAPIVRRRSAMVSIDRRRTPVLLISHVDGAGHPRAAAIRVALISNALEVSARPRSGAANNLK